MIRFRSNPERSCRFELLVLPLVLFCLSGCEPAPLPGALILTQVPLTGQSMEPPGDILDPRYPPGSRVVLAAVPFRPSDVRILSKGLSAAGGAVILSGGKQVLFVGKATQLGTWQIYQASVQGGTPRQVTSVQGGAMDPTVLPNDAFAFSSPVPNGAASSNDPPVPALYAQKAGAAPERLTFSVSGAVEPTALSDGRILFVSERVSQRELGDRGPRGLFTINNDGTEFTSFALDGDGAPIVHRPRQLRDGRVGFIAGASDQPELARAETVRTARPFASRSRLSSVGERRCTSIEPGGNDSLLACLEGSPLAAPGQARTMAVYRLPLNGSAGTELLFDDPAWDEVEAVLLDAPLAPMGHISAISPSQRTGTILCLDANYTRATEPSGGAVAKAHRIRVTRSGTGNSTVLLGEVPVQPDGSFLVEVPADTALGFEALDPQGAVLRRLKPSVWVRPGENRSCIGCHEPPNRSPKNHRPLAVTIPPVSVIGQNQVAAHPPK